MDTEVKEEVILDTLTEESESSTQMATYEEVVKTLAVATDKNQFHVPVSKVFGAGTLAKTESFGGRTLAENTQLVDAALQNSNELQNIWNRSHSQWDWKHINLSYHSEFKNVRQIAAEINRKKQALDEAKWKHVRNEIKLKKIEEKLNSGTLDYWKEVELRVDLAEKHEQMATGSTYIEGAMKDILALNELYDQMKDKFDGFTETDFELEESKSHLKRSLVQCIRDVRQTGSITKGEQEYLEQIGVNPSKMLGKIREYVDQERKVDSWDTRMLHDFVDHCTTELIENLQVDKIKMDIMGFKADPTPMLSYDKPVALKLEQKTEEGE